MHPMLREAKLAEIKRKIGNEIAYIADCDSRIREDQELADKGKAKWEESKEKHQKEINRLLAEADALQPQQP